MKRSIFVIGIALGAGSYGAVPPDYQGKPFEDSVCHGGAQIIPGRLQCAYFDFGGAGVAYHSDGVNHGSGVNGG